MRICVAVTTAAAAPVSSAAISVVRDNTATANASPCFLILIKRR
jgi:hypothetical protein